MQNGEHKWHEPTRTALLQLHGTSARLFILRSYYELPTRTHAHTLTMTHARGTQRIHCVIVMMIHPCLLYNYSAVVVAVVVWLDILCMTISKSSILLRNQSELGEVSDKSSNVYVIFETNFSSPTGT